MKKIILTLALIAVSCTAFAKGEYIFTDHRFNFVKIEDMSKKDAERLKPNQPYKMTEEQMREILKDIKLSRTFVIKKETDDQEVFGERAINFLAHKLVEGLTKANDKQKLVFSYLSKEPMFILRNDRLTIAEVWVEGENTLHFKFNKLYAKLLGDTDKKGDFAKIIGRSKGLRVELETDSCQGFGDNREDLVVDVACASGAPEAAVAETTAKEKAAKTVAVAKEPAKVEPAKPATTRERLKELEQMKEDGLITDSEYKRKRRDILKGL